jgi:hypothetical protein
MEILHASRVNTTPTHAVDLEFQGLRGEHNRVGIAVMLGSPPLQN